MLRIKNPQDFGAGIMFMLIGVVGLYLGHDLRFGTARAMGPGYFPMIVSALILVIGTIVAGRSLAVEGPVIEPIQIRPILFLMIAIGIFAFLIAKVGLAISGFLLILISAYGRRHVSLIETLIFAAVMSALVVLLFPYALGAQIPIWWK